MLILLPATMSALATPTKTAGKARAGKATTASPAINAATIADDIIPILLACSSNLSLNYKQMAALDRLHRTASSFEHKFRKWRAAAKQILEAAATTSAELGTTDAGDRKGPTQKRKAGGDAPHNESDDNTPAKPKRTRRKVAAKIETSSKASTSNGTPEYDEKATVVRRTTPRKGALKTKAPAFDDATEPSENEWQPAILRNLDDEMEALTNESPATKARVGKKGVARVVKKKLAIRGASVESDEGSGVSSEEVEVAQSKAKANGGTARQPAAKPDSEEKGESGTGDEKGEAGTGDDTPVKEEETVIKTEDAEMHFD